MTTVTKSNFLPYLLILSRTKANCGNKNIIFREDFKVAIRKSSLNSLSTFCVLPLSPHSRTYYTLILKTIFCCSIITLYSSNITKHFAMPVCAIWSEQAKPQEKRAAIICYYAFECQKVLKNQSILDTKNVKMAFADCTTNERMMAFLQYYNLNMIIQKCKFDQWHVLNRLIFIDKNNFRELF